MTDQAEALQRLLDQLKAATQEAHGILRDIRTERAETQAWLDKISTQWRVDTDKKVAEAVEASVGKLGDSTRKAIDAAVKKVFAEFDGLFALMTGKGNGDDMEVVAAQIRVAIDHIQYDPHPAVIPAALRRRS
jgi:hypothetical protein